VVEILGEPNRTEREVGKAEAVWEVYEKRFDLAGGSYRGEETSLSRMDISGNSGLPTKEVLVKVIYVSFVNDLVVRVVEREQNKK
jgi:hypothetical protein